MIRLLIADDHPVVRSGLLALFATVEGYTVVGEAADGAEAVAMAAEHRPDVVLMDLAMPRVGGVEAPIRPPRGSRSWRSSSSTASTARRRPGAGSLASRPWSTPPARLCWASPAARPSSPATTGWTRCSCPASRCGCSAASGSALPCSAPAASPARSPWPSPRPCPSPWPSARPAP
ncbi:response regulator [Streptosporangiaceae bacterium NEAU-GS5]|nr:response regulator [Streptosporangiaceae bacterium NEAU-GS5]